VLITLNVVVQLQLHYAPYPDLKQAVLPRCLLPLHRLLPLRPPRPHPGTPRDPFIPQYPVLSNDFRRFPLRHGKTIRVVFRHFQALFCFVLIILYSLNFEYDRPLNPSASGLAG